MKDEEPLLRLIDTLLVILVSPMSDRLRSGRESMFFLPPLNTFSDDIF